MSLLSLNFSFASLADTLSVVQPARTETADDRDIRAALGGNEDAYRRLIDRHQTEIAKRLRKFTRDPLILEELVHDTFVEAWLSLKNFRNEAPFIHWLHRIAVRTGYRHWKTKKSAKTTASIENHDVAKQERPEADTEALDRALNELSPRDRLVVTLMYLEDHTVEETAALTGWSKTMVKVQSFRARSKLRKMMKEFGPPISRIDTNKKTSFFIREDS